MHVRCTQSKRHSLRRDKEGLQRLSGGGAEGFINTKYSPTPLPLPLPHTIATAGRE